MFIVYILKLKGKKSSYIGVTENIERRLEEHKTGKVKSTKGGFEKLIYTEEYTNKKEAWKREKFLKSGKGREWIKQNVKGR